jgi:hypothetical protein
MTVMTIERRTLVRHSRLWLPFACVMLAFFSFASMACAAECSGTDCAQMAGDPAPTNDNNSQDIDIMMAGGCALCCNVIIDQAALNAAQPLRPPLYAAVLAQQSSRYIAPDIPPPRMFDLF